MNKALVLMNMGGPRNLDEVSVFLKNMFDDPRILSIPVPFIRKAVGTLISTLRVNRAKKNYQAIGSKSPLPELTERLVYGLQQKMPETYVTYVMRYTPPFSEEVIKNLKEKRIHDVILFSMYPQYSTTTTLSSIEAFRNAAKALDFNPRFSQVERYYNDPVYNEAILDRITGTLGVDSPVDFNLVFSAHGLPKSVIEKGDPYQGEIEENVRLLLVKLKERNIHFQNTFLAYQSKIGPMKWLEPSLEEVLLDLKDKKVLVYPLAFTVDNSETDYELDIEYRMLAEDFGISDYRVCRCLNDSELFQESILNLVQKTYE